MDHAYIPLAFFFFLDFKKCPIFLGQSEVTFQKLSLS